MSLIKSESPADHWSMLKVDRKYVLDIGCGLWTAPPEASTPKYFLDQGASAVTGCDASAADFGKIRSQLGSQPVNLFVFSINSKNSFVQLFKSYRAPVVKIDVEGAEEFLQDVDPEVMSHIEQIAIEYHDSRTADIVMAKLGQLSMSQNVYRFEFAINSPTGVILGTKQ